MLHSRRGSVSTNWTDHPDPERLAAYIERTLERSLRADVEAHLAECEDCRLIVMDTGDLLAEERGRRKTPYVYAAASLAAAAVLAIAVWAVRPAWIGGAPDQPRLDALVAALANEATRPVEGRLSADFPYKPAPAITRGTGTAELLPDTRIAVAEAEADVQNDRSVVGRWTLGITRLVERDDDAAIAALEEAVRGDASRSALQSDLSAAYLARARVTANIEDLRRGLAAADRALALDAASPAALFNRALALQALGAEEAAAAWRAFRDRDGDSEWAGEARTRSSDTGGRLP